MGLAQKLFGTQSSKEIKRIMPLVHKIEGLRSQMMELSDEESARTRRMEFKKRLGGRREAGRSACRKHIAVVREASRRVLTDGARTEVQIIGGIILHQGRIAEMRTGEGKTLGIHASGIPECAGRQEAFTLLR